MHKNSLVIQLTLNKTHKLKTKDAFSECPGSSSVFLFLVPSVHRSVRLQARTVVTHDALSKNFFDFISARLGETSPSCALQNAAYLLACDFTPYLRTIGYLTRPHCSQILRSTGVLHLMFALCLSVRPNVTPSAPPPIPRQRASPAHNSPAVFY